MILDEAGRFVARVDLLPAGTMTAHEYDGPPEHRTKEDQARDLARDRRLLDAGYARRGVIAQDLMRHWHLVVQEACRGGRPVAPSTG